MSDAGPVGDGGATPDASVQGVLPFKPSNIDLGTFDLSQVGDVDLSGTSCILDSESPDGQTALLCDKTFANSVAHKTVTLPDLSRLSVFVVRSLRIEASTVLSVSRGHLPVVLVALDTMELLGSIDVAPGTTGGAFDTDKDAKGAGPGGGTAGDTTGLAGGGGSFCGLGGKAGTYTAGGATAPSAPAAAYGTAALVPLVGGSAGGSGALTDEGSGGGALQLVAGTSFALRASGFVNVGGGGGTYGGLGRDGAGGGGSGGALLIESPTVTIEGKLAANGGGGGQGNGDAGEPGHPDVVAQGGHKPAEGAPAGNGSFGGAANGDDGPSSADATLSAGSGGGGAGRIRINTTTGSAAITGTVSPSDASGCSTIGALSP